MYIKIPALYSSDRYSVIKKKFVYDNSEYITNYIYQQYIYQIIYHLTEHNYFKYAKIRF